MPPRKPRRSRWIFTSLPWVCSRSLRKRNYRQQWRNYVKTHSSSNFLHKAEHGAAPFQRLHRILHKNFVIRSSQSRMIFFRLSKSIPEFESAEFKPFAEKMKLFRQWYDQTFSLLCWPSFSMATTIPVRANRARALGRTMRLLNISVSSHTKSLPVRVPRKMNTRAMMV